MAFALIFVTSKLYAVVQKAKLIECVKTIYCTVFVFSFLGSAD